RFNLRHCVAVSRRDARACRRRKSPVDSAHILFSPGSALGCSSDFESSCHVECGVFSGSKIYHVGDHRNLPPVVAPLQVEEKENMSATRKIRVVLTDDHRVVTQALRSYLESFEDIQVLGTAVSGEELIERLATQWTPDVIVLDLLMPGGI